MQIISQTLFLSQYKPILKNDFYSEMKFALKILRNTNLYYFAWNINISLQWAENYDIIWYDPITEQSDHAALYGGYLNSAERSGILYVISQQYCCKIS